MKTGASMRAMCEQGQRLLAAGATRKALRVFEAATVRYPLEAAPWIGVGFCRQAMGDAGAAAFAYTLAQGLGAEGPGLSLKAGEVKLRLGALTDAVRDLEEALRGAEAAGDAVVADRARRSLAWVAARSVRATREGTRAGGRHDDAD